MRFVSGCPTRTHREDCRELARPESRWAYPDPGMVAVTIVAAVGAAGLIVAQRTIWPVMA